jgi:hypothetical protein
MPGSSGESSRQHFGRLRRRLALAVLPSCILLVLSCSQGTEARGTRPGQSQPNQISPAGFADPTRIDHCTRLLRSDNPLIRSAAIRALCDMATYSPGALHALVRAWFPRTDDCPETAEAYRDFSLEVLPRLEPACVVSLAVDECRVGVFSRLSFDLLLRMDNDALAGVAPGREDLARYCIETWHSTKNSAIKANLRKLRIRPEDSLTVLARLVTNRQIERGARERYLDLMFDLGELGARAAFASVGLEFSKEPSRSHMLAIVRSLLASPPEDEDEGAWSRNTVVLKYLRKRDGGNWLNLSESCHLFSIKGYEREGLAWILTHGQEGANWLVDRMSRSPGDAVEVLSDLEQIETSELAFLARVLADSSQGVREQAMQTIAACGNPSVRTRQLVENAIKVGAPGIGGRLALRIACYGNAGIYLDALLDQLESGCGASRTQAALALVKQKADSLRILAAMSRNLESARSRLAESSIDDSKLALRDLLVGKPGETTSLLRETLRWMATTRSFEARAFTLVSDCLEDCVDVDTVRLSLVALQNLAGLGRRSLDWSPRLRDRAIELIWRHIDGRDALTSALGILALTSFGDCGDVQARKIAGLREGSFQEDIVRAADLCLWSRSWNLMREDGE